MANPLKCTHSSICACAVWALLLSIGLPSHADIDQSVNSATQNRENLARLVAALRAAQQNDNGQLSQVFARLDVAGANRRDVLQTLTSLLPDVSRLRNLSERRAIRSSIQSKPTRGQPEHLAPVSAYQPYRYYLRASDSQEKSSRVGWLQLWADNGTQDATDGFNGFDASSTGLTVGFDFDINNKLSASLSAGLFEADVDSDIFGSDDQQGNEVSIALSYQQGQHTLTTGLGVVDTETERERVIVINPGIGPRLLRLASDIDTQQRAITLGYTFTQPIGESFLFSPNASISYTQLSTDDYIERGTNTLSLNVATDDEEAVDLSVGVDLAWFLQRGSWAISPSISAFFEHDFAADPTTTTSTFRGRSFRFSTRGYDVEENRWRLALGFNVLHDNGFMLGLSYNGHRKSGYSYDALSLTVQAQL